MKRICLYLAFLAILSGCVTQKRCYTKFPPARDTIKITTIRDSIIFRDTTIFIKLPGKTVIDSISIPCPEVPGYIPKKVYAETSLAKATAWWSYPIIKLELIQKDTTIEKRLDNALKDSYHWKSEYEKITVTPHPVKFVPGFYKFCTFAFIGVIIAGIGFIMLKFVLKK